MKKIIFSCNVYNMRHFRAGIDTPQVMYDVMYTRPEVTNHTFVRDFMAHGLSQSLLIVADRFR